MENDTNELTEQQAIAIYESEIWKAWNSNDIVQFQLFTSRLCMPFDVFHEAVETVLNRPVWTHEFAFWGNLQKEYLGEKKAPTFEEIMNLIPEEKRDNTVYYCDIGNGKRCGLICEVDHGDYIYSAKETPGERT